MTRPATRLAGALAAAGAVATLAACFELSGPADGIASVSALVAPSPSVALGDVMRDSTGAPAPLRVIAFDADGDTIPDAAVRFVVLDRGASVDATGLVRGDSIRGEVRVVGIAGALQTAPVRINVVPAPLAVRDSVIAGVTFDIALALQDRDSLSAPFGLVVTGAGNAPVAGWPVRFRIERSTVVASSDTLAPVTLVNDSRVRSTIDTTDARGEGLRRLRVLPRAMNLERLQQRVQDTVLVRASTVVGVGAQARVHEALVRVLLTPR